MNRYKYIDENRQHLHTLDGRPLVGTSSVSDVIAKPLTWWASGLAVQTFGCPDPKVLTKIKNRKATPEEIAAHKAALKIAHTLISRMDCEQFATLIDKAYRAHDVSKREKAVTGTDLHAECERFVKYHMSWIAGTMDTSDFDSKISPFIEWTFKNVKRFLWSEGHCYSEKHWIGGICDAGYEKLDGTFGVLDFKSSREAYIEQFWQCAGYSIAISENGILDRDGNQIYAATGPAGYFTELCVFPFGMKEPAPQFNVDVKGCQEAFLAELLLYNKMPKD